MEKVMEVFAWIMANYEAVLAAVMALLSGIIAVALLVPGQEPERTLQKIVDFLKKFSKK